MKNLNIKLMMLILGIIPVSEMFGQNPTRRPGINTKGIELLNIVDFMTEKGADPLAFSSSDMSIFAIFDFLKYTHSENPVEFDSTVDSLTNQYALDKKALLNLFYNSFAEETFSGEYSKRIKLARSAYKITIDDIYTDYIENLNKGGELNALKQARNESIEKAKKVYAKVYAGIFENYSYGRILAFPTRFKRNMTRYFYSGRADRGVEILENNFFNINTEVNSGSLYSEVLAGYLGPARISLGGMVSTSELRNLTGEEVTNSDNLDSLIRAVSSENDRVLTTQSFLAGGGNALLNASVPWLYYHSKSLDVTASLTSFYRFGFLLPEVGTTSDDIRSSSTFGLDFNGWIDLLGEESDFALVISAMIQRHTNQENTNAILGVENKNFFWSYEVSVGLDIGKQFRISFNFPNLLTEHLGGDPLPNTVSLNLLPFK